MMWGCLSGPVRVLGPLGAGVGRPWPAAIAGSSQRGALEPAADGRKGQATPAPTATQFTQKESWPRACTLSVAN